VRVFVSSTIEELADERAAAREAIIHLHLVPVLFELGAHAHPPRDLYRAYLAQSDVFVGIYWQQRGWVARDMDVSRIGDEYELSGSKLKLIYIKTPAPKREPQLQALLDRIRGEDVVSYQKFSTPQELRELLENDLAVLLTERFEQARPAEGITTAGRATDQPRADESVLPSGTVTFLYSDIEGSTQLLRQLGTQAYAEMLDACQQLLRVAWSTHRGYEVDALGDKALVAFSRAGDALAAAYQAQSALATYAWPAGATVRARMGLHSGTPMLAADHYVGLDVQRVARVAASGHGGQVLLTEATRALVESQMPSGARLRDLGHYWLKDLQHPEHLFQVVLPHLAAEFPPLRALNRHPYDLPTQPTPLVGRDSEVTAVRRLLRRKGVRLVTLTGPAGVGKTRLALEVATGQLRAYADGVCFVRLSRLSNSDLVVPTVAQTLGLRETGSQPVADTLQAHLRDKRLLLVLDNFEQVVEAAPKVAALLAESSGLRVLVTSRAALHLSGEHEYPVPPLALPEPARLPTLERLTQYAGVSLFVQRAQAVQPDFQLTPANAPAVAAICTQLDGLPLAIELAASRVRLLPPLALLKRLEQGLALLAGGARDLPERQQTMERAIAWSYDLLAAGEQRLFRRLCVFVGGCTLEAAEAVCTAVGDIEDLGVEVLDGLGSLVDKNLVRLREEANGPRFGPLHVIREYGLERLGASGEVEVLQRAHAAYYLGLAEEAEACMLRHEQEAVWLMRLEVDHDNLRAALSWAREREEVELGLRLASALWWFWHVRGYTSEGRSWLEGLLAMAGGGQTNKGAGRSNVTCGGHRSDVQESGLDTSVQGTVWAEALFAAGTLAAVQGDRGRAIQLLEESLALRRALKDTHNLTSTLNNLGFAAYENGDLARAISCLEESVAIDLKIGKPMERSAALANLGEIAYYQGDLERAVTRLEEALAVARQADDALGIANILCNLGRVAHRQGDLARATELLREGLKLRQQLSDRRGIAESLEYLASATATRGMGVLTARLLGAAEGLRSALGVPQPDREREETEHATVQMRTVLGEPAWAAAFADGRELPLEQAIQEALDSGN
jgi:predicted ATPase/class 3 adenylate cyclase